MTFRAMITLRSVWAYLLLHGAWSFGPAGRSRRQAGDNGSRPVGHDLDGHITYITVGSGVAYLPTCAVSLTCSFNMHLSAAANGGPGMLW